MKAKTTWVLLANGANARIVENTGVGTGVSAVEGMTFGVDIKKSGDIFADRPGRVFDSGGAGRHSMEHASEPVREREKRFAESLCSVLEKKRVAKKFDRLVVVAAPQTLGDLRNAMSAGVAEVVHAELDKDLTHVPNKDLPRHLENTIDL